MEYTYVHIFFIENLPQIKHHAGGEHKRFPICVVLYVRPFKKAPCKRPTLLFERNLWNLKSGIQIDTL